MLLVTAVLLAGCSGTTPAASSAAGTTAATPAGSSSSGSSGASAAAVSGIDLFGGLSYNWVEYKISTGSGADAMTVYYKYNRQTGKCTMRFEGAGAVQGMPTEMDCSAQGSQTSQGDPNQVSSDTQVSCSPLEETVVVPAGTFSATKCTMTAKGTTATSWIAKGKFIVKSEARSSDGSVIMELNSYG
jgi:hypothetical protein